MAQFQGVINMNIKTGEVIELDAQRAAASRCFGLLMTCAHTIAEVELNMQKGNPAASAAAIGGLVASLAQLGGKAAIEADTRALAKLVGCDFTVQVSGGTEGQVH